MNFGNPLYFWVRNNTKFGLTSGTARNLIFFTNHFRINLWSRLNSQFIQGFKFRYHIFAKLNFIYQVKPYIGLCLWFMVYGKAFIKLFGSIHKKMYISG